MGNERYSCDDLISHCYHDSEIPGGITYAGDPDMKIAATLCPEAGKLYVNSCDALVNQDLKFPQGTSAALEKNLALAMTHRDQGGTDHMHNVPGIDLNQLIGDPRYEGNLAKARQQISEAAVAQAAHEAGIDAQYAARATGSNSVARVLGGVTAAAFLIFAAKSCIPDFPQNQYQSGYQSQHHATETRSAPQGRRGHQSQQGKSDKDQGKKRNRKRK